MKALTRLIAFLALVAGVLAAPAHAAYPARPDGPVLDEAGIIPDAREAAIDARLREYNAATGRAVVVATVDALDGETIEMYAANLFEAWGIGGAETDQGLLLLVAPNERKVRIEVGYGLTPYVTDILSGRIIRGDILPAFKAGDYPGGIEAGLDSLITQMDLTPAEAKAVAEAAAAAEAQQGSKNEASFAGVVFWVFMIVIFALIFGRRSRGRRYRRRGGIDPWVVLWGASEIARHSSRGSGGFGGFSGGSGGGFGGFGGGMSGGGGASGSW